jgi:hypothetical protein
MGKHFVIALSDLNVAVGTSISCSLPNQVGEIAISPNKVGPFNVEPSLQFSQWRERFDLLHLLTLAHGRAAGGDDVAFYAEQGR